MGRLACLRKVLALGRMRTGLAREWWRALLPARVRMTPVREGCRVTLWPARTRMTPVRERRWVPLWPARTQMMPERMRRRVRLRPVQTWLMSVRERRMRVTPEPTLMRLELVPVVGRA